MTKNSSTTTTMNPDMEQTKAPNGFVPRPGDYDGLRDNFKEVHTLESERKRSQAFRFWMGWGLAGVFFTFSLVEGVRSLTWPHAQDHFRIAIVHNDGTYDAPVDVNELTPVQQKEILETSLVNYVNYRESYAYAASQKSYDIVSAMTAGKELKRYQKSLLDQNDPENPIVKYGLKAHKEALDIRLNPDPNSNNSWNFTFTLRVTEDEKDPVEIPMRGSMTFVKAPVSPKFRVPYDPASVAIIQYESHEVTTR
uniref:Bacterial virulence protein VirB8 domain-containing protein n=2 Tax=Acetobacter pasteurianus TaxID=438 RepID=I3W069_ACEPA|nr:hypothetical protein [Acetobacter pasteurianus]